MSLLDSVFSFNQSSKTHDRCSLSLFALPFFLNHLTPDTKYVKVCRYKNMAHRLNVFHFAKQVRKHLQPLLQCFQVEIISSLEQ